MAVVIDRDRNALAPSVCFSEQAQGSSDTTFNEGVSWVDLYQEDHIKWLSDLVREAEEDSERVASQPIRKLLPAVARYVATGHLERGIKPSVLVTFARDGALVFSIKWAKGTRSEQLTISQDGFSRLLTS